MPKSWLLLLYVTLISISISEASPTLSPPYLISPKRQVGNCTDLRQNLTQTCWEELGMANYLYDWWQVNQLACGGENSSFVSCYQQSVGVEEQQCDTTGPNMCDYPEDFTGYTPQQAYTLYTVFAIWQWFESIYEAIENADLSAGGPVGKIVKTINPEVQEKQSLGDFLQALTAFAPLLSLPAELGKAVTSITETAMRQSPGVLKQLNPTGTLDSEIVQISDIYDGLGTIKTTYQQNISNALALVQQDFSIFNLFAANGSFIAPRTSLEAETTNLTAALETYIVSSCLTASNIIITLARETNPQELANNGSMTTVDLIQCASYDRYGICSDWWYDPDTNAAYSLSSLRNMETNYYDLMENLFSNGWTTGADLFLGAKACADYVAVYGGANDPTLDPVTLIPRCISNVQVCVWDQSCEPLDKDCAFTGEYGWDLCKPQYGYEADDCGGSGIPTEVVPAAYLGPLTTITAEEGGSDLIVCHGTT
ncbi:MAG: hypothetical protein ASARMPRED_004813 [Alectoria sarmentosa]|nr:MAG: hypothetical protein ASARMPRED_004813 [Alectoria sarmentosa]